MLPLSPNLRAKLDQTITSFCHCWRLARRDGFVIGFTDHDRDLNFNSVTYRARAGVTASELENVASLAPGVRDVIGALTDDSLNEKDLKNGLYDGASVETWLVDWYQPEDRLLLDVATIGEVRRDDFSFTAELRSASHVFDQPRGRAFQLTCPADVGDNRCKINLASPSFFRLATIISGHTDVFTATLDRDASDGFLTGGIVSFETGPNAGARFAIRSHRQEYGHAIISLWTPAGAAAQANDIARLTAGCDKRPETCRTKFGNIVNFRGFPHMPGNDRVIAAPASRAEAMDGGSLFR
jgi:uncharacterized phage protein (TIGR02218 family)